MKVKIEQEVDVKTLSIDVGPRYWEDTQVNGVEDTDGDFIPHRDGDRWKLNIDIEAGQIRDWVPGVLADVHYKICDDGTYTLKDSEGKVIKEIDGYVPDILSPGGNGYGDYIIMKVNTNGIIANWRKELVEEIFNQESL